MLFRKSMAIGLPGHSTNAHACRRSFRIDLSRSKPDAVTATCDDKPVDVSVSLEGDIPWRVTLLPPLLLRKTGKHKSIRSMLLSHPNFCLYSSRTMKAKDRGKKWLDIGLQYCKQKQFTRAMEPQRRALSLALQLKSRDGELNAYHLLGTIQTGLGQHDQAIMSYQRAIRIAQELEDKFRLGILYKKLCTSYRLIGQLEASVSTGQQAIGRLRANNQPLEEADAMCSLAMTYVEMKEFYYDEALDLLRQVSVMPSKCSTSTLPAQLAALRELGSGFLSLHNYSDALWVIQRALFLLRNKGNLDVEARLLIYLGSTYGCLGDMLKAIQLFEKALVLARKISNKVLEINVYENLAIACKQLFPPRDIAAERYEILAQALIGSLAQKSQF
eukprot:gb/GEZN01006914.1/.p1 GENE.gb/GEZN01006914.1/~~gb/GEZN01006914.1/.p1  ORF type:complete len:408 (-),score=44.03 gb/GEZN01006914.1/:379-1539(-)